jgi:proline iminopeptidase
MNEITANGTRLATYTLGEGASVLLLGGMGIGHAYLRPGMDVLADEFKLVYYDPRGTGNSPLGDESRVTIAGNIEDLEALRVGLGLDQLNLLGHSFGADLAVCYAGRYPERVRSLVLASPGPPFTPDLKEAFGKEMQSRRTTDNMAALQTLKASKELADRDPKTLEELHRQMYLPFFRDAASSERVQFGFTRITADNVMAAPERMFRDLADANPLSHLSAITCATLVVHAKLDPLPEAFSARIAGGIAKSELAVLEGVNHFAYIEDPEPFFGVVRRFLRQHAK